MPLRNRVTPYGELIATEARGDLFGNRGVLHDDEGRIVRSWQVRRWIACRLEFKGRRRPLLRPGRYTELFFLDEATALAAGHRPCAECRREDYLRFRDLWPRAPAGSPPGADAMDRILHAERLGPGGGKRLSESRLAALPDGVMLERDGRAWLLHRGETLAWTPFGYRARAPARGGPSVLVLTPPSIVEVIRRGYEPRVHASATRASDPRGASWSP